jgi:Predicted nucleic-acid-binding protein containing a Zn-ribbon
MPDPRPQLDTTDGVVRVIGVRCTECGYPVAFARLRCPVCRGPVETERFGPDGVVWSATTVRIPVGDREPPYQLAYVDLQDGPRILAHVAGPDGAPASDVVPVGARVRLRGRNDAGDAVVEVLA